MAQQTEARVFNQFPDEDERSSHTKPDLAVAITEEVSWGNPYTLISCFKAITENLQVAVLYYVCLLYIILWLCVWPWAFTIIQKSWRSQKLLSCFLSSHTIRNKVSFFQEANDNSASLHDHDRASFNSCSSIIRGKTVHFIWHLVLSGESYSCLCEKSWYWYSQISQ